MVHIVVDADGEMILRCSHGQIVEHRLDHRRREFNLSVAELDLQDQWQQAVIGCAMIANQRVVLESSLQTVWDWVEGNWPDGDVIEQRVEVIP